MATNPDLSALPIEFCILGTPISLQGSPHRKRLWKSQVQAAMQSTYPGFNPISESALKMTIVYFHDGDALDVDNMVKPIADALEGLAYNDDSQISDLNPSKRDLNGSFKVKGMSEAYAEGFKSGMEFVMIRIEEAPNAEELI